MRMMMVIAFLWILLPPPLVRFSSLFHNQTPSECDCFLSALSLVTQKDTSYFGSDPEGETRTVRQRSDAFCNLGPTKQLTPQKEKLRASWRWSLPPASHLADPCLSASCTEASVWLIQGCIHSWGRWVKGSTRKCHWLSFLINHQCVFSFVFNQACVLTKQITYVSQMAR